MKQTSDIKGYRQLTQMEQHRINLLKQAEQLALDSLNEFAGSHNDHFDLEQARWLAIARTHIQQGFMAAIRVVARPGESDEAPVPGTMSQR